MPTKLSTMLHPQVSLALAPLGETPALVAHLADVVSIAEIDVAIAGAVLGQIELKPPPEPAPATLDELVVAARRRLELQRARGWSDRAKKHRDDAIAFKLAVET